MVRGKFGFFVQSFDTAQKIFPSKQTDPPAVLLRGPRDCPPENFRALASLFGDVAVCSPHRRTMGQSTFVIFYKHELSARLLCGMRIHTKGGLLTGTCGVDSVDQARKVETCQLLECNCNSTRPFKTGYEARLNSAVSLQTSQISEQKLLLLMSKIEASTGKKELGTCQTWMDEVRAEQKAETTEESMQDIEMDKLTETVKRTVLGKHEREDTVEDSGRSGTKPKPGLKTSKPVNASSKTTTHDA